MIFISCWSTVTTGHGDCCFVVEYELLLWVLIVADNVTIANAETLLAVLPNDRYSLLTMYSIVDSFVEIIVSLLITNDCFENAS